MISDPYQVLGVARTATADEIRTRYLALAKQHHPDAGGSEEIFAAISAANDILSDPEKRERFDQTGRVDDAEAKAHITALAFIAQMVMNILQSDQPVHPKHAITSMRQLATRNIVEAQKAAAVHRRSLTRAEEMAGQFRRTDDGPNILAEVIKAQIDQSLNLIEIAENAERAFECAAEILAQHDSIFDLPPAPTVYHLAP